MRRNCICVILALVFMFPAFVKAEGYINVSPSSLTIEQGQTKTFDIVAYNVIGDVQINSNDLAVAIVDKNEWSTEMVGEKEIVSGTITVTGIGVGKTSINLIIDGATFDSEDLSGQTKTITVNVIEKPQEMPVTQQPSTPTVTTPISPKNTDATLKAIELSSGSIEFASDKESYDLIVGYDISTIEVNGIPNDNKASVRLEGDTNLKEGDNIIKLVVTAEDGITTKTYTLNIKRENKVLSKNSNIKKIIINNYNINFNKNKKEYDLIINNEDNLTINVELEDELAKYEILGNKKLKNKSVIKVIVTAEDGTITEYKINIIKEVNKTKKLRIALIASIILNTIIIGLLVFIVIRLNNNYKDVLRNLFKFTKKQ